MLPEVEEKLQANTSFKKLVTSAMSTAIKMQLDALTLNGGAPTNAAEQKVLDWCRNKMQTGSVFDHSKSTLEANLIYVGGMLTMFDDEAGDDIVYTESAQGALIIDWNGSKPIMVLKVQTNAYLYGLAGVTAEDFAKTELINGVWSIPVVE